MRLYRASSWLCALLVGAWVAWLVQPLTLDTLLAFTNVQQYSYENIYSELHERPFAFCDSYSGQRRDAVARVTALAGEFAREGRRGPLAALSFTRAYDAVMLPQYEEDCRSAWRRYQQPANLQKVFAWDYPLYFLISELRLSEIDLTLLQFAAGWLGVVALSLLTVYFWRSPVAPLAALAGSSWLVSHTFIKDVGIVVSDAVPLTAVHNRFLYPAVTLGLVVALLESARTSSRRAKWMTALLATAFAIHGLVYYIVDPPVVGMLVPVALVYLAAAGAMQPRWLLVGGALFAAALHLGLDAAFLAPGRQIYSAVSTYDHLGSEAYTRIMMYMGFLERPGIFGLFYTDEIFNWLTSQDPVIGLSVPYMVVHHSYAHIGNLMLREALSHPVMVIDAVFRRLLVQTFFRSLWYVFAFQFDWIFTTTLAAIAAVNLWAWRRRPLFWALTPVTLSILVSQFAVNTFMTLVHTHSRWNLLGVMLMYAVAPLYVFAAERLCVEEWRRWSAIRAWRRHSIGTTQRPLRTPALGIAATAIAVFAAIWLVRVSVRSLREERVYAQTWIALHLPPPAGPDITAVVARLEGLRRTAGDPHGEIAMWITSVLAMYDARYGASSPARDEWNRLRHQYYRAALLAAPDNPHYLYAAKFLGIDRWESYTLEALRRFPDAVYAAGAEGALRAQARDLPRPVMADVTKRYDEAALEFMAATGDSIPGFQFAPSVARIPAGSVTAAKSAARNGRRGLALTMSPGAEVVLSELPTYGSSSVRLISHLDLRGGALTAAVSLRGEGPAVVAATRYINADTLAAYGRLQMLLAAPKAGDSTFGLWLKAGDQGAVVDVRDYYPIVDFPEHYYRSALMDRVRRTSVAVN